MCGLCTIFSDATFSKCCINMCYYMYYVYKPVYLPKASSDCCIKGCHVNCSCNSMYRFGTQNYCVVQLYGKLCRCPACVHINFILHKRNWKLMINVSIPLVALFKERCSGQQTTCCVQRTCTCFLSSPVH